MTQGEIKRALIGELIITPRALADYRDMFLLTDTDLTAGPILDCPGGSSPFGAQVRARGGRVVSVDPAYDVYWQLAAELFFTDFAPDDERYVAARLPSLPFADREFRLALSSWSG